MARAKRPSTGISSPTSDDGVGHARAHEKTDCQLYSHCLHQAAKGIRYSHAHCGGAAYVPCQACTKYKPKVPERADPWGQPRSFTPPWDVF